MVKRTVVWIIAAAVSLVFTGLVCAQDSPVGVWKTIDDDGETAKSYVRIQETDGVLSGNVVRLLKSDPDKVCENCPGEKKGQPILGMEILWGLKKEENGNTYSGGEILDPDNGKTYRCKIWREGNTLKVRGYIAFLFRTQTWHLVQE
jgi:uncharacterized protein (DUF2147 family)